MRFEGQDDDNQRKLLQLALDHASSPLIVVDEQGACVYLNEAAEELTGYRLPELEGQRLLALIPHLGDEHRSSTRSSMRSGLPSDFRVEGEYTLIHECGDRFPVRCTFTPLELGDRAVGGVAELSRADSRIQEQRPEQSTTLTENEEHLYYRLLLDSMNQGFFVCDIVLDEVGEPADYRFAETNHCFEELTGLRNAKGKSALQLVPNLEPHWVEIYGRVALTGEPIHFSEESPAMGRWFDVYAFRVGGAGSLRVAALFTNVTERKRTEEEREELVKALELERSRLETVFQKAPAAIATLRGRNHVFEMVNPLYRQLVGKRELIGRPAREVFPELRDQGIFELLDNVYETGEPFVARGMHVPIHRDSDEEQHDFYLDFVYQPLREADGSVSGIFAHAVDVTEHKQAVDALAQAHDEMEERVEERTAELKALNEELESFNYSVSHDLRSPLRAIDGFTQILLEEHRETLAGEGTQFLHRIRAAASRMGELIDDLLKLSRLTRAEMSPEEFDLTELTREVVEELLDRRSGDQTIEVTVAEGLTAVGDRSLIRIAIANLVENAMKFTDKRAAGIVRIGATEVGDETVFFVQDNGAGFSMKHSQKLFVPFQRLHSPREYAGSGIGLATVQRIVHKHGGRIWAEGKPDEGAVFYFTLAPASRRASA